MQWLIIARDGTERGVAEDARLGVETPSSRDLPSRPAGDRERLVSKDVP